jgi:hypothetical protein
MRIARKHKDGRDDKIVTRLCVLFVVFSARLAGDKQQENAMTKRPRSKSKADDFAIAIPHILAALKPGQTTTMEIVPRVENRLLAIYIVYEIEKIGFYAVYKLTGNGEKKLPPHEWPSGILLARHLRVPAKLEAI